MCKSTYVQCRVENGETDRQAEFIMNVLDSSRTRKNGRFD
ncbi:hypothetical protein C357_10839 [Citreicella sp. 357]|nr:hypothetical protein C357_10839 [Citreicella sp. 357]